MVHDAYSDVVGTNSEKQKRWRMHKDRCVGLKKEV